MRKIATIAAAALLASVGTYALAQAPAPTDQAPAPQEQTRQEPRRGMSQDTFNRMVDARIAAIKAGLKLSADQERLWGPVEAAIRTSADERFSRFEQRRADRDQRRSMDFMQRLEQRSTSMTENAQRSSALATALRPLWDSFSEDQKQIAPRLMREVVNGGRMGRHERGGRRGHDGHHARMGEMRQHHRGMMEHGGGHGGAGAPAPQQQ
jgi:hypothetical protein